MMRKKKKVTPFKDKQGNKIIQRWMQSKMIKYNPGTAPNKIRAKLF